jgi:hypothetical protein
MAGTITRGKIVRADLAQWDGRTETYSRIDATGGTVTGLAIGNEVDVLQVFGSGSSRTRGTIADAVQQIGSSRNVTLVFAPGTWTIDVNLTIPSNLTCHIPAGCIFSVDSGITLTFSGDVHVEDPEGWYSGSGTVVVSRESAHGNVWHRSAAERTASVTPSNFSYPPGDDRRYSTFANFCSVISQGVEGHLYSDHSISAAHDITGDARIIVHGERTITLTATASYMLKHSGELTIDASSGELLFDADTKATNTCLHSTNNIPNLKNVRFLDSNAGVLGGDSADGSTYDNVLGDAVWENVVATNCANVGYALRGHATAASRTASLVLKNCRTTGTTGSGDLWSSGFGFLTHFSGMKRIRFEGGDFTGDSGARNTNALECSHAEIFGGFYHDVLRGPTLGENTQNFSIIGAIVKSCSDIGVAVDTTNGVSQTVGIGVVADCVMNACGRAFRSTCSHIKVTGNHAYECTDTTGVFAFAGTSNSYIYVDDNHVYSTSGSSAFTAFIATGTTVSVIYGRNYTNSTQRNAIQEASGCSSTRSSVRTVTANTDVISTDHEGVIYVDASSGAVDVDLPDEATIKQTGFWFRLIALDTTNQITITFQGGAASGETVNGGTSLAIAAGSPTLREYLFHCKDGPNGVWYAIGFPPATPAYTATNVTTDRTYDADTALVAETNDVLGMLLRDLGLR